MKRANELLHQALPALLVSCEHRKDPTKNREANTKTWRAKLNTSRLYAVLLKIRQNNTAIAHAQTETDRHLHGGRL